MPVVRPSRANGHRALASRSDLTAMPEHQRLRWLRRHVCGRLVAGEVTAAERAWLEKTGAGIGFERARVTRTIIEEAAAGRTWFTRLASQTRISRRAPGLLRPGITVVVTSCVAACIYATAMPAPSASRNDTQAHPRPAHIESASTATIGNTDGAGVFLRAAPSRRSEKQRLRVGTHVQLTGRIATTDALDWSEVEALGKTGWVATRYLVPK